MKRLFKKFLLAPVWLWPLIGGLFGWLTHSERVFLFVTLGVPLALFVGFASIETMEEEQKKREWAAKHFLSVLPLPPLERGSHPVHLHVHHYHFPPFR